MCIENETAVIEFLLNLSKDIDELIEPFLFINKTVKGAFSDKIKIFVQKYDDPETKDHFISVQLREKSYPEDFIDKVWGVREKFSATIPRQRLGFNNDRF